MDNTRRELEIRKNEATSLLMFVKFLDDGGVPASECSCDIVTVKTSMKANVVMMLYNAVEATVTQCLEKVHDKIKTNNVKYRDLSGELQKLIAVYYGHSIDKSANVDNAMDYVLQFSDFVNGNANVSISYKELTKKYQLYSGNLDTKEILNVLGKYGVDFEQRCSELKTIKDYRNKLAHGEESFEEIGRVLSVEQLLEMKSRAFEFLENMINAIAEYLTEENYMKRVGTN